MRSSTHVLHPRAQNRGHHPIDLQKEAAHGKKRCGGRLPWEDETGPVPIRPTLDQFSKVTFGKRLRLGAKAQELSRECYTYRDVAKSAIYLQRRRQECYTYRDVAKSAIPTETSPRVLYLQRRRQVCYIKSTIYLQRCRHLRKKCDVQVRRKRKKEKRKNHNNKLFTSTCPSSSTEWACLSNINGFTA